ncbi:hypothetical protein D3C71_1637740 [compost metagenome]
MQRGHHERRHADIARRDFLLQQALGHGLALGLGHFAQCANQRLQRRGQAFAACQMAEHGVEHLQPDRVEVIGRGHQRHRMLLGQRNRGGGQGGRGQRGKCLVLGIDDARHKQDVVGNRVAIGELTQARGTVGKQAAELRQADAREIDLVNGLDLAALKNTLHGVFSK